MTNFTTKMTSGLHMSKGCASKNVFFTTTPALLCALSPEHSFHLSRNRSARKDQTIGAPGGPLSQGTETSTCTRWGFFWVSILVPKVSKCNWTRCTSLHCQSLSICPAISCPKTDHNAGKCNANEQAPRVDNEIYVALPP